MANPSIKQLTAYVWTKVATNVTAGIVHKISNSPNKYLQTYRMTGGTEPTGKTEGVPLFVDGPSENISATSGIDVYIMPVGSDGKVRIDLP